MVSGFFGAGIGGLTFITSFNYLTQEVYRNEKYNHIDFRFKNLFIYFLSDMAASVTRVPFECRKQLVQMCNYDIDMKLMAKNTYLGLFPLMARDVLFRQIIFGTYYMSTHIEHRPTLKYSIP